MEGWAETGWACLLPPRLGDLRKTTPFLWVAGTPVASVPVTHRCTGRNACVSSSKNAYKSTQTGAVCARVRNQKTPREMGNVIVQVCPEPESTAGVGDPGSAPLNSCLQPPPALECRMWALLPRKA